MHTTLGSTLAVVVAALLLGAPAGAEERKDSGSYVAISGDSESYELSNRGTVDRAPNAGFLVTEDASSPLHLAGMGCIGSSVVSTDGKTSSGGGHCVISDRAGDLIWAWWLGDQDGGTWGFLDGTGKFAGAQGNGIWTSGPVFAGDKLINQWTMTWQMK